MVERSRPWSGTVPGDSGPYTDDQWTDVWKGVAPILATQGVFLNQLNDLDLSGVAATPVSIDTGRALVNGIWYESDASVTVAIPDAVANPRVDRIVLRADWALQTVRITRLAGAEAAAPVPLALTQVDGVTWELPLWQVFVAVGPASVLTFYRDERAFIGQYEPSEPTDELVYIEDELFWPELSTTASAVHYPWRVTIAGNYNLIPMPAFGRGAIEFGVTGGAAGDGSLNQPAHRPDLIDAHLIVRAKSPNVAVTLDREIGWVATTGGPTPANGVWFRADGTAAANWFAVCRAGGVETAVDTGQAPDNTWRKFEIRQVGTDVVTFLIDDVVVATIQTDIPAADLILVMGIYDDGAAPAIARYQQFDRIKLTGDR
jgi:hypothetical protein